MAEDQAMIVDEGDGDPLNIKSFQQELSLRVTRLFATSVRDQSYRVFAIVRNKCS